MKKDGRSEFGNGSGEASKREVDYFWTLVRQLPKTSLRAQTEHEFVRRSPSVGGDRRITMNVETETKGTSISWTIVGRDPIDFA